MSAIAVLDGADQSGLELCGFEDGAEQPGGGGLAIGSRDAGQRQLFSGEVLLGHGEPGDGFASVEDDALGQSNIRERSFGDDRLCTCRGGRSGEGMAVADGAADRHEDIPRCSRRLSVQKRSAVRSPQPTKATVPGIERRLMAGSGMRVRPHGGL